MDNTLKKIRCVEDFLQEIDYGFNTYLEIDTKLSYGIVTRQFDYNGKITNVDRNPQSPTEGEIALWDDRYSMVWFHRVNDINIEETQNGKYGRQASSIREQIDVDTVVWAAVNFKYQGQHRDQTQMQLYRKIMPILVQKTHIEVKHIKFDMTAISREEFVEGYAHKEVLMLKFNYQICHNLPKECFCLPPPIDCKP